MNRVQLAILISPSTTLVKEMMPTFAYIAIVTTMAYLILVTFKLILLSTSIMITKVSIIRLQQPELTLPV